MAINITNLSITYFNNKTYENFINDAKEISKIDPRCILNWFAGKPTVYTNMNFKKTLEKSYLQSCIIQKKEEYSEITLKWITELMTTIILENPKVTKNDLELFKNVKLAFKQLAYEYSSILTDKFSENHQKSIFKKASYNYKFSAKKMNEILEYLGHVNHR